VKFLVTEKSAKHSITFIAPLPTSPVDVQTAEPTLGDTSIVFQSVTNNQYAPSCGGTKEKWVAHKKFVASMNCWNYAPHLKIGSDATVFWQHIIMIRQHM